MLLRQCEPEKKINIKENCIHFNIQLKSLIYTERKRNNIPNEKNPTKVP